MPAPFSTSRVVVQGATPVLLCSWQRGPVPFWVRVRNDSGARLFVASSSTGTAENSWPLTAEDVLDFEVPAAAGWGPVPPAEQLWVFTGEGQTATASGFIAPR